jgi:hypothetical protein
MKTTIAACLAFVGKSFDVKAEFSLYYMKFNGCSYIVKWAWKMKCREKFYKMLLRIDPQCEFNSDPVWIGLAFNDGVEFLFLDSALKRHL